MRFVRAATCAKMLDTTTKTWYDWVKHDPTAPQPVIQAGQYSVWLYHEVQCYMRMLIKENRTGYIKDAHLKEKEAVL